MNTWACVVCHSTYAKNQPEQICADCRRHRAIGVLVDAAVGNGVGLEVLDAIADLLGVATGMRRRHNRELRDEQLGAQRDARQAYGDGLLEGQRNGEQQW